MAIKIYPNRIEFEKYSLVINETGFLVTSNADPANTSAYGTFTAADTGLTSTYQGTTFGYVAGASPGPFPTGGFVPTACSVQRFPFATDSGATGVGNLSVKQSFAAGASSTTHGFVQGGGGGFPGPSYQTANIDRFPFSIPFSTSTSVGNITCARYSFNGGQSSYTHGYAAAGYVDPTPGNQSIIDKFSFAAPSICKVVGNLTQARYGAAAHSSANNGYVSNGNIGPAGNISRIDKFSFATDACVSFVGSTTCARNYSTGMSSAISGYSAGGGAGPAVTVIDKFPFIADGSSSSVGNLAQALFANSGVSGLNSGYSLGGEVPGITGSITKFPFATDTNSVCIGALTCCAYGLAGIQD